MLYLVVPPGQYKCEYRDKLIGRAFLSEEGAVIVTGKTEQEGWKLGGSAYHQPFN